ncbi:MAG: class C sortase [Anaerovoracaceae bacterium]|nr:class C sortase [Anaerovoracaceae bacterium]
MKKKTNSTTIFLILVMIAGLSLLLYPSVSDYWNSFHQTQAIASYAEEVAGMNELEYDRLWTEAQEYNEKLAKQDSIFMLSDAQKKEYTSLLDVSGTGIMGYIEIPSIRCSLPIYHGTEESALQIAVGHLEWSSLPVGGESTHCVLSGHRGLPSAKLFTNLDQLKEGDVFMLRVLDEVLTYEVDQILIVEPQETGALTIEKGKDYCTLVTCTPYGVNTHRLLVRGHRIENMEDANSIYVTADASQIEPLIVAPVLAVPILLLLLIAVMLPGSADGKKKRKKKVNQIEEGKETNLTETVER